VLYFFIPWTAVNLVDYFLVRKGHYAIGEIFRPDGIYGRWLSFLLVAVPLGFLVLSSLGERSRREKGRITARPVAASASIVASDLIPK